MASSDVRTVIDLFVLNSKAEIIGVDVDWPAIASPDSDPYNDLIQQFIKYLYPELPALQISRYPNGARRVVGGERDLRFSLSHAGSRGVLIMAPDNCCIGIDLHYNTGRNYDKLAERVVRDSEKHFLKVDGIGFDAVWSLKEAALKAWGIGMRVAPWDVEIRLDAHQLTLHNLEQEHLPSLYGSYFSLVDDYVIAFAWLLNGFEEIRDNFYVPRPIHLGV